MPPTELHDKTHATRNLVTRTKQQKRRGGFQCHERRFRLVSEADGSGISIASYTGQKGQQNNANPGIKTIQSIQHITQTSSPTLMYTVVKLVYQIPKGKW